MLAHSLQKLAFWPKNFIKKLKWELRKVKSQFFLNKNFLNWVVSFIKKLIRHLLSWQKYRINDDPSNFGQVETFIDMSIEEIINWVIYTTSERKTGDWYSHSNVNLHSTHTGEIHLNSDIHTLSFNNKLSYCWLKSNQDDFLFYFKIFKHRTYLCNISPERGWKCQNLSFP